MSKPMTKHASNLLFGLPFAAALILGAAVAAQPAVAGMDHGAMGGMGHEGMGHEGMGHEGMGHEGMSHEGMSHEGMGHKGMGHEGMGHGGMMGDMNQMKAMMHEMMGGMVAGADDRIAALRTALKITDAQAALWKPFADALKGAAESVGHMHHDMMPAAKAPEPAAAAAEPAEAPHGDASYPDAVAVKKTGAAPAPAAAPAAAAAPSSSLPARLAHFEEALSEHLASLKAIKSALDPLYAAFSDEQKKIADGLMVGPMGVM